MRRALLRQPRPGAADARAAIGSSRGLRHRLRPNKLWTEDAGWRQCNVSPPLSHLQAFRFVVGPIQVSSLGLHAPIAKKGEHVISKGREAARTRLSKEGVCDSRLVGLTRLKNPHETITAHVRPAFQKRLRGSRIALFSFEFEFKHSQQAASSTRNPPRHWVCHWPGCSARRRARLPSRSVAGMREQGAKTWPTVGRCTSISRRGTRPTRRSQLR
jgi:hypothetical protein